MMIKSIATRHLALLGALGLAASLPVYSQTPASAAAAPAQPAASTPAQPAAATQPTSIIRDHDLDGDGKLSKSEATSASISSKDFDAADANHDGMLDSAELSKWLDSRGQPAKSN
jgi:hypothetical protein